MHPAIPIATQFLSEHTGGIVQLLEHRSDLNYGIRLAEMLQQVIMRSTAITQMQIEAILTLTRQTHDDFSKNLRHYEGQHAEVAREHRAAEQPRMKAKIQSHLRNLETQMSAIRHDMAELTHFSATLITSCAGAGMTFTRDLSIPYHTELKRIG